MANKSWDDIKSGDISQMFGCKGGAAKLRQRGCITYVNGECLLCPFSDSDNGAIFGPMEYRVVDGIKIYVHELCLYFASNLRESEAAIARHDYEDLEVLERFTLSAIARERRRGQALACSFCSKKGATIGCSVENCKIKMHFSCGRKQGQDKRTFHIFADKFPSYCVRHLPAVPQLGERRVKGPHLDGSYARSDCPICRLPIQLKAAMGEVVRTTCCTKEGNIRTLSHYYHYECIFQYALQKGEYHIKCLYTNTNVDGENSPHTQRFMDEIKKQGVWIPGLDQAQGDPYDETMRCVLSQACKCPSGPEHHTEPNTDTNINQQWEFLNLCPSCGALIHRECAGRPWAVYSREEIDELGDDPEWRCAGCTNCRSPVKTPLPSSSLESDDDEIQCVAVVSPRRTPNSANRRPRERPDVSPGPVMRKVPRTAAQLTTEQINSFLSKLDAAKNGEVIDLTDD